MRKLIVEPVELPGVFEKIQSIPRSGKLAISQDGLVYLDIADQYVHYLYPLLGQNEINIPDYFGEHKAGAHISLIYPHEARQGLILNYGRRYGFDLKEFCTAVIGEKRYYFFLVQSEELLKIRIENQLPKKLLFKEVRIDFHITVGWKIR